MCVLGVAYFAAVFEKEKSWDAMSIQEHVAMYENQGIDRKEAMRMAAKDRGISKRDVYQQLLS